MPYIYNQERFHQAALLKGLEHLSVYSTDIDMYIDLGWGKLGLFVEFKTGNTELGKGQRQVAQSLLSGDGVPRIFVVATHDTKSDELIAPNALVSEVMWKIPGKPVRRATYPQPTLNPDERKYTLDGEEFEIPALITLDEFVATLAMIVEPRNLRRNGPFWLWADRALDEVLDYFHPALSSAT
jgi:hypothetical protein